MPRDRPGRPPRPPAPRPPPASPGSWRRSRQPRDRPARPSSSISKGSIPSTVAIRLASPRAAGEEPATAQPAPASSTDAGGGAKVWSGCSPKVSPRLARRAPARPAAWRRSRDPRGRRSATVAAAAAISASGTQSSSARTPAAPRRGRPVPSTASPAARSAPASAVPMRPAPTTPSGASGGVFGRACIGLPVHSMRRERPTASRIPSTTSHVAPRLCAMQSAPPPSAARSWSRSTGRSRAARAARWPQAHERGVRGRQRRRRAHVRRRGTRAEEDLQGLPFVGRAGKLLDELLARVGLTRDDMFITNVLKCRPPGNRDPAARRDRGLPPLPGPADRADPAAGDLHARQLRHQAAHPLPAAGSPRCAGARRCTSSAGGRCGSTRSTTRPRRCARPRLEELR